ncbi:MAG: glycosyltransferase [Verrucomicrobia bacterium]|nr:glycosyltransferase [Verrucomicrobiota bacterium]
MAEPVVNRSRVRVDGKFFRRDAEKFYPKGIAYGPFAPDRAGETFASLEQTAGDFALIRELGANLVRVYHIPPRWLLDLAGAHDLLVMVDIPWDKHLVFLDDPARRDAARAAVRKAVSACAFHPAVFAFSVANEIPTDIVRWSGASRVANFVDELVLVAKRVDPDCLCTFTNYPPTEFLRPQSTDFVCFNVYLHQPKRFRNYLARLQMLADAKPLVLGEFGIDSIREGEPAKCEMLRWQIETTFRGGLAGAVVFSFTDDWHRGGRQVEDWQMGLTTVTREPKESFHVVQEMFRAAPHFPLLAAPKQGEGGPRIPKVSVVVASYNGERTLRTCLDALENLNYPDYEVVLVDDGSTDNTAQLVANFRWGETPGKPPGPKLRFIRHEKNRGLSVARNTGIRAALGEIIAFTDSDCRPDEDWLRYLVSDLLNSEFAAMGGHNLLPPDDSAVAAAVMVSPGGPAHVMLDDRHAEHIPGCNMSFYKWALDEVGGFDPIFTKAGDDVDICWRLQQAGMKIGFSPAAFVWHYRRSNIGAYLKQQRGYGEAEALLVRKHPEYFNSFGDSVWRGRIYSPAKFAVSLGAPIIYRGVFGSGMFQTLYAAQSAHTLMMFTTLEYHLLVTLPVCVLSVIFHYLLPVAVLVLLVPLMVCVAAGAQADVPKGSRRWWSGVLVGLLFFLQPLVRGWSRHIGRVRLRAQTGSVRETFDSLQLEQGYESLGEVQYWSQHRVERVDFVAAMLDQLNRQGWQHRSDIGWSEFDVEFYGNRWSTVQLVTAAEDHQRGRLLRCRLRANWSLQGKLAFWILFALELLVIGLFRESAKWLGVILASLPVFAYYLHRQKRHLQSLVVVFLDKLAEQRGLLRIPADFEEKKTDIPKQE